MKTIKVLSRMIGAAAGLWASVSLAHPHPAGTPAAEQFHWHAELGLALALLAVALLGGLWWWNNGSRARPQRSRRDRE
jgi:H+/gluconate symporter-like permease